MKRLLFVGGHYSDIPLIVAAKQLGYHVTTSGNRPSDLGHSYADAFISCDYSVPEAVLSVAQSLNADRICACCNDFSAVSSAYAAEMLRLPGHDSFRTSRTLHHKDDWREFCRNNSIPSPAAIGCKSMEGVAHAVSQLRFPLIVKPVDLTGGKGIQRVDTPDETTRAAKVAFGLSRAGRIVIEEFITGSRHGFSAILRNRRVVFHFVDDEHYHLSPYLVSAASSPSSASSSAIHTLIQSCERIAELLELVDGILHVQFIQRPNLEPVIIEVCRRAPGDLYVELVRHSALVPYSEWIVRGATGMDLSEVLQPDGCQPMTRLCLMAEQAGFFRRFNWAPEVEARIIDQLIWVKTGEPVEDPLTHKFGIVFVRHPDEARMRDEASRLQSLLSCEVD